VEALPHQLGQTPHPQQIKAFEQGAAILMTQAPSYSYFLIYGLQSLVLDAWQIHGRSSFMTDWSYILPKKNFIGGRSSFS
jgi:hypothetical protein